jgi:phosphopantetheinyl transferase
VPRRRICGLTDPSGKPRLQPVDGKTIFISLAHVEDILLMVLATDVDVGIDVEVIRHRRFARQIAARYFDYEPTTLHEFYRAWTAREAFIKAIGSGIGSDLARIRTKKCGPYLEIGLDRHYSHMVSFFTPLDNVVAALCRPQSAKRGFTMITN